MTNAPDGEYPPLNDLFAGQWTIGALMNFHTAHKLVLMAHSPEIYRRLGRFVGGAHALSLDDVRRVYTNDFMAALRTPANRGTHANVLQHMAGYFSERLDPGARAELTAAIDDYRRGQVELDVPLGMIRGFVRTFDITYLAGQVYLDPARRD